MPRGESLEDRALLATVGIADLSLPTDSESTAGVMPVGIDCRIPAIGDRLAAEWVLASGTASLRLNELKVNPPGSTLVGDRYQYVELSGEAGLSLNQVYFVMLDGNGSGIGRARYVADLSSYSLGSNGLLMIKSPTSGHAAGVGTTIVSEPLIDSTPGGLLSKQSVTFQLVTAQAPVLQGSDYDTNDDGLLDNLPAGFSLIDSVGWSDGDIGDRVYGNAILSQSQGTPDAATRIVGNLAIETSAWFNGDLFDVGNIPAQLQYDSTRRSSNLPVSPTIASLTPGASNFVAAVAASELRVVSYNIATPSSPGVPRSGLETILQAIGNETVGGIARPIDLLALQEVDSQSSTTAMVVTMMNTLYGASIYTRGTLNGGSLGGGTMGLVYNTTTLQLLGETTVGTTSSGQPRQTLRYHFQPVGGGSETDFYVYNSHWKAVDDADGRDKRRIEAEAIRANADALGNGKNILYVGDFNVYSGSELAFQAMIGAGSGQAFDPINRIGNWSNNSSFVGTFTQAPASIAPNGLVGGGLDDRFDFQLITDELRDGRGIDYRSGSYRAFGNNGSVPMNGSINNPSNTALAGLSNRATVLNLLTTVSDHLPVVADFTVSTLVDQADVRFNEVLVNPSDTDDSREFIELIRLSPTETLRNVWLLEIETDSLTGRGTIDHALNLSNAVFGSNDLLMIGNNYQASTPYNVPTATGRFNLGRPGAATMENSANLLLVYNFSGSVGLDYDANDDGILDSTPWTAVIDALAIAAANEPAYVPGTKILNSDNSGVVDAVVRFPGNSTARSSAAFYGGEILDTGTNAIDLQFQSSPARSSNFPAGGVLTPADVNAPLISPRMETVVFGDGTDQRSMVTQIQLDFDTEVILDPDAFLLEARSIDGGGAFLAVTHSVHPTINLVSGRTRVTLNFSGLGIEGGSLADGNYRLTALSSRIRSVADGRALDGDNNGTAGGDYRIGDSAADNFFRLFGDSDGNGVINPLETNRFRATAGKSLGDTAFNGLFDFDGNGSITPADINRFRQRVGKTRLF